MKNLRTDWAKEQISKVQSPVYKAKAKKVLKAKRHAKFEGAWHGNDNGQYSAPRRLLRNEAMNECRFARMIGKD